MPTPSLNLPFKARFTASAHVYRPNTDDQYEVRASVERLRGLLPSDIDPATHPTLLYVVGNLFVAGLMNLNDDAVTVADSLRIYRAFEGQQVNIEHNRGSIVGYIVKAGLSEFGTDRLISEDEARAANQPFNVAIVVAIWRVADRELVEYILEGAVPGSPVKDDLSLSFEVGFDDYTVVTLPEGVTNLAMATSVVTSVSPAYATLNKALRINKGAGKLKGERVGRILAGNIVPLGGGIVMTPAAAVRGITPVVAPQYDDETQDEEGASTDAGLYTYSSTQATFSVVDAAPFVEYARAIPDNHIYTDPEDSTLGRETETHCTILYGIKGADATPIQQVLATVGPVSLTLGKVSMFEGGPDRPYDVLKVDVASEDLNRLHHLLRASCDCEVKWPDYHPHLTLAYMQKGTAQQYVGDARFEGQTYTFSAITFSPHTGTRVSIALQADPADQSPVTVVEKTPDAVAQEIPNPAAPDAQQTDFAMTAIRVTVASAMAELMRRPGSINRTTLSVSTTSQPSSTIPMDLKDLQQSIASVKSVEDLPATVASMTLFVEEIAKASEAETKARKDAETVAQQAQTTLTEVKAQLEALTKTHNELVATQQAAAAEAAFQSRMNTLDEVFAFDEDTRTELVEEVKACANDELFSKWLSRAKKLFKHLTKESIAAAEAAQTAAAKKMEEDKKKMEKEEEEEECAKAAQTAIASAAAAVVDAPVINTPTIDASKSLKDRMREAFANSISIGGTKVTDLNKQRAAAKEQKV